MYVPHLLKEFKQIDAIGDFLTRPAHGFDHPDPKIIEMTPEQNALVVKGMWGSVNAGGTSAALKSLNFEVAGKTGTAQNSSLGSGGAKDHAWFVSFAPASKPEIAILGLIENSGFGGTHAAPAVRKVYEAYLQKAHPDVYGGLEVGKNKTAVTGLTH